MARRNDHSRAEIEEMALAAAEDIVSKEGYAGLTARKVAERMGYTPGTIYFVFKNLDDLILHVNARTLDALHQAMTRATARCRNPQACLLALGHAYIRFARRHSRHWGMVYEHRMPEGEALPGWYQEKVARVFGLVQEAIRALRPQRPRREIEEAAHVLWGGVHGIGILALTDSLKVAGAKSVEALVDSLIRNYLAGFTTR